MKQKILLIALLSLLILLVGIILYVGFWQTRPSIESNAFVNPPTVLNNNQSLPETNINSEMEKYSRCSTDNKCQLVKSFHPCKNVQAIDASISPEAWKKIIQEEFNKNAPADLPRCRADEFDLNNAIAVCQNGYCQVQEKNTRYAQKDEPCFEGSQLKKNQCATGLVCLNPQTQSPVTSWTSGICQPDKTR